MDITIKFSYGGKEKYTGVGNYLHTGAGHVFTHKQIRYSVPDTIIDDYEIVDPDYDWYCIECERNSLTPLSYERWVRYE